MSDNDVLMKDKVTLLSYDEIEDKLLQLVDIAEKITLIASEINHVKLKNNIDEVNNSVELYYATLEQIKYSLNYHIDHTSKPISYQQNNYIQQNIEILSKKRLDILLSKDNDFK